MGALGRRSDGKKWVIGVKHPRAEGGTYFAEPLEEEPDLELEDEVFAEVELAPEGPPSEKGPGSPEPGPKAGQPPGTAPAPKPKSDGKAIPKAAPDSKDMDWDDTDITEVWEEPDLSRPAGLKITKTQRTVAPVVCPACKKTFDIVDEGKRPLMTKCAHCGKEGVIKGSRAQIKDGIGIRCPNCKTQFDVGPDEKDAVCPTCGAVGTVPK